MHIDEPDPAGPPADDSRSYRLLVADDSPTERSALARILRSAGYEVDEAEDGKSTILLLKTGGIDLLLLDLLMPGSDGFEVLAYLQQNQPDLPVILLSGLPPDQIQHSMHRLPTRELPPLLLKPVEPEQLLSVVGLRLSGDLPA